MTSYGGDVHFVLHNALIRAAPLAEDDGRDEVELWDLLLAVGETTDGRNALWRSSLIGEHQMEADLIAEGQAEWQVDRLARLLVSKSPVTTPFPRIKTDGGFVPLIAVMPPLPGSDHFTLWAGPPANGGPWSPMRKLGDETVVLDWRTR